MAKHYLACDLGAESGRLMLGTLDGSRLELEEIHRFTNTPLRLDGSLQWNIPLLFDELKIGLRLIASRKIPIQSIGCDAWGVDYVLFDDAGKIISPTFHYRDDRCARGVEAAYSKINWPAIFAETGIQFIPINTIFQLAAESSKRLARARRLLMIGDAFNFLLSGVAKIEESMASTSQLYNPRTRNWSARLLDTLNLPAKIFPEIVSSGTRLGKLLPSIATETGLPPIEVIATCAHDTAAAVAAVPTSGGNWAYISSGTWSLMGAELSSPIISDACRELNFTNEIGFGGTVRLLKNIVGLWIVQECRREWSRAGDELDYAMLASLAAESPPFASLINPADARFAKPGEMPAKIAAFCRETSQPAPTTPGATIRCVLESLALLYRKTRNQIEQLIGKKLERLHVVGGGGRNGLLNQFTANALQIPVLAGPVEATAAGNVLVQAIALGDVSSLAAARKIVADSTAIQTFLPCETALWNQANERFERLLERSVAPIL
ncbi:MAG: rhamnulokinase [Verrucomicrobia bacterium]|nr:rhamnulokinase [Verrucomicrobiota bacterium]